MQNIHLRLFSFCFYNYKCEVIYSAELQPVLQEKTEFAGERKEHKEPESPSLQPPAR